ncbi:MAG TPA: hypothetical protein VGG14_11660 [Candidatus Sulfotelmatobacter sp.]|jgi:hypothetical protein
MGLFDSFRKEEIINSKVLVGQLGTGQGGKYDEEQKSDLRVYKRFYPAASSATFTTVAELRGAVDHKYDILHLFCDVGTGGIITDASGDRLSGSDLLKSAIDAGIKLLWIGNDNPQEAYEAGFKTKGLKINTVLTLRRLGSNTSLLLDSLLVKMQSGETLAKAWSIASQPEGKSVQPDVPHTITSLGRGSVVLK